MAHLPHVNFEPASFTQERDGVGDIGVVGMPRLRARLLRVPVGIMPSVVWLPTSPSATFSIVPSPPETITIFAPARAALRAIAGKRCSGCTRTTSTWICCVCKWRSNSTSCIADSVGLPAAGLKISLAFTGIILTHLHSLHLLILAFDHVLTARLAVLIAIWTLRAAWPGRRSAGPWEQSATTDR